MNERARELLRQIYEMEFTCIELQLYLDTHPDDQQAQQEFIRHSRHLRELKAAYDKEVAPLHNFGYSSIETGSWVTAAPWPWEC